MPVRHPRAVVLGFAAWVTAVPTAAQEDATLTRRVDSLFSSFARSDAPGLAVAVVKDGRALVTRGYGMADLEHRVPITPSTVFDVASVSKQFAGLAIAMLVDEGRLRLDDDVRKYIPELADFGHPITINHLVHHTSGLRDWPGTLGVAGWRYDDVISFAQILSMAFRQRTLNFVPGAEYTYSNTGYNLLAEVVQRVSGRSFRAWTDERFFQPLGMRRTIFRDDHTLVIPDRAIGYQRGADGSWRQVTNNLTALGSSSLMSSVEDLARWVINFDSMRVGGARAFALARSRGVLNDGSTIPYAFGLSHGEYRGVPTLSHSGSWAAFATFVLHFPQHRAGIVVLANTPGVTASQWAYRVADLALGEALASTAETTAGTTPTGAGAVQLTAAQLDEYAGTYRLGPGWYVTIRREGDRLSAQATNEGAVPMEARSALEFWVPNYGASMTFVRGGGARVTQLMYRGRPAPRMSGEPPAPRPPGDYVGDYTSDEMQTTYRVVLRDGVLRIEHPRHGTLPLQRRWGEEFGTSLYFLRGVTFTRGARGRVDGLLVNVDERSRDIRFRRLTP